MPTGSVRNLMTPRHLTVAVAALAMIAVAGCGGGTDSKAVVTVDGEPVTNEEFHQYLTTKRTVRVIVQNQIVEVPVAETLAFQALQELATQKLILHMAADEGLLPTEKEVEAEIEFKKKVNPNYLTELKAAGYSMGQIRREVMYGLSEERLLTRGITVDKSEVDKMIENNPQQFIEPATVTLYEIMVLSDARKAQADQELAGSTPFKTVATKHTQNPNGPRLQYAVARLQEPLKSALEGKPVGFVTDWIPVGNGHVRYFIDARTEEKPMDMTPEKREMLRRQLALSYGRQANDLAEQVTQKLRGSDVRISEDEATLKDMWKRFKDRLEKRAEDAETAPTAG
jgi:hypothetical protein